MNLPKPTANSLDLIDEVVAERQGGVNANFFTGILREWREKVGEYIAHGGSPEHVKPWPKSTQKKERFLNLYKSPAQYSAQGAMLKTLRDHGLNLCPACGESGRPNTLDHYLPKDQYPHFAITPLNLFPMCDACQGAKGVKTGDINTPRFFIHPYFDTFSIPQIVALSIQPPFKTPSFAIAPHPGLSHPETKLVKTHLHELKITDRYTGFFRAEHLRLLRQVANMRASNQDIVQTLTTFQFGAASPSPNSWEHIFYKGVLENPDFLYFLVNADLPPFL